MRLTDGAANTVSWAQSLHGLLESSLEVDEEVFFDGPTVGIVVADRFDMGFVVDIVGDKRMLDRTLEDRRA